MRSRSRSAFPLVTGGAVRFWIYGPAGLSAGKIASLTAVAGITFWLGMALRARRRLRVDVRSDRRDQSFPSGSPNRLIGLGAHRRACSAYFVWTLVHAPAREARVLRISAARAHADAWPDGARRHRRLRRRRRALCAAAEGQMPRLSSPSARSTPSPRCSASPAMRRAGSACSRRRCSRASAATERRGAGVAAAVSRHLLSRPVHPRDGAARRRTRRRAAGVRCAKRWRRGPED